MLPNFLLKSPLRYSRTPGWYIWIALLTFTLNAEKKTNSPEYKLLQSIRSPQELIHPIFPRKYCASVSLSGPVADEMTQALKNLDFQAPLFNEYFDGKTFHLQVANSDYPEQTRDLLSGLLNPLEMIDMAVESVVKYKTDSKLAELIDQTNIKIRPTVLNGRPVHLVRLSPKGERFGYSFNDNGALIEESWLTDLRIAIDTSLNLVFQLQAKKHSRRLSANAVEKPRASVSVLKYIFSYEFKNEIPLPSDMTLYLNDALVLQINAGYRFEGKSVVFDTKKICCVQGTEKLCLEIAYKDYSFRECAGSSSKSKAYNNKLEKASLLSKKAADAFRKGNINVSMRVLEDLIEKYGDTPQAVEARRLLYKLPSGLR